MEDFANSNFGSATVRPLFALANNLQNKTMWYENIVRKEVNQQIYPFRDSETNYMYSIY